MVRYVVAVSIDSGDIFHINDSFRADDWPDIDIFMDRLTVMLDEGESVEAGDGCRGKPASIDLPAELFSDGSIASQWARHRKKEIV